ncbi:ankyrin repeat domain-containing protein [Wolbachia endosymbiont of Folsomia candida]|uniref:ankyrin repeat domain-containing protein n=1 Tax=Wolbachia endosymbiont of Folsomia candida TaxID=169402 RepID=UPI001300B7A5|nr:ankyrin repeat domain-containing protein [Wolbachia endosymbiont of Folsomia candida]
MKHGIFLTRGFAGLISSPFDIYDLVSSSIDLANSKKGTKEWRDSIAGVVFSGSSVATGVAFTALGKPGVGTVVGLGIIIGQGLYSGTSMVIEYKKYKLTTNQEFRLFWHTFALQLPPEDVQYLAARKDVVNKLAEQAWEYLQNNTHVAAYGMGLGEIRFVDDTHSRSKRMIDDMEQSMTGAKLRNDVYVHNQEDLEEAIKEILPKPKTVVVEPSSSSIGMSNPSNERNGRNLSRIVPVSPSSEAEMLCLPQFTHRDYEYGNSFIGRKPVYTVPHSDFLVPHWDSGYGDSPALYSNSSTAIYHCHNAIIVGRKNDTMENPTMVFDLSLVNGNGLIVSSSKYNNQFNIAQGGTKIYGSNHTSNVFTLTDDNFFGRVSGGTANATNVLDVSQLKSKGLSYENNIVTTQEAQMTAENINHFIGRKAEAEHVDCQNMNNKIVIDSRGGNSGNSDVVSNCRKVIVTGNTKVVSNESDNTFYIKPSAGHAEIRGEGKGFVIFSDTALLQRASNISYSSTNNTLSIEIQGNSGNSGTFTLDVQNYLDKENNHHYLLIDKYGSVIEPIIQQNSTHFNLKAEINLTNRDDVAQRYQEISQVNGNYTVYGVVRDLAGNNMIFGSEGSDVIPLTQNVTFAQGNEESDVYSLISGEKANVTINNYDEKKALDILYLPTDSIETNRVEDDLHIATGNVTANIKVENFFRNSSYRHLTIIDKDKNTFLPWPSKQSYVQLVPFFHATKGQYMFLLSAEKVQNNPEVIVDAKLDDIRFYRYGNDLMLMDDQPLIVKVENFYGNQYGNFTLNFRSKEKLSSKQLSELAKIAINYQDEIRSSYYDSFREYRMSTFNSTIYHNQKFVNGSLTTVEPDDKRVGILLLKDPADIEVSADNNDLVFAQNNATFVIKNWNETDHRISMLRFGQEDKSSIEVRKLDKFDLSEVAEIQAVINKAAQSNALDEQLEKLNGKIVNGLKYLFASNGIANGIDTYSCLGFDSMEDQQEFVAAYSTLYNKEKLKEVLQDSQVVEALTWLITKGYTNLSLKNPDKEKLNDLDQCFGAKDNFTIENRNKVSVLKFNQTIEVDLSEVSEIQHLISKYGITQLEELSDEEEFKYLLVGMDIRNGIYSCVAEKDTQKIYNPYYYEWINWNLIKDLIEEDKFDVNRKANDGNTILHEAASSHNLGSSKLDVVKYLVDEKKDDVNSKANDGRTPLHHAAFSGSLDLVKYLIDDKKADINIKSNDGKTSLHYAAYSGNLDLVKYLVEEKRVDVNTKDNYGNTLLHEAASSGNLDLVKYLIDKGADVNAKTNGNWTSLHKAAEKGHKEVSLALLDEGADINAKTNGGWTALHWAAYKGNTETVLALLNKGANVNARTDSGETALHMAEQHGRREIVDLLKNTTTHQRSRRAINTKTITSSNVSDDLEFFAAQNNATPVMEDGNHSVEEKATSSAIRTSSLINDLFGWVKGSIGGLFNSRTIESEKTSSSTAKDLPNISQVDVDGIILLLDVFIRKITGKKPISTEGKSMFLLEAQGHALNITTKFEQVLNETAVKSGISVTNLKFNQVATSSAIVGQIRNGNFSEISKTLYSSAKEASPEFKQTDKFLDRLKNNIEEVLAEKEVELLVGKQKPINVDRLPKAKPVLQEDKPKSLLSDLAIENSSARRIQ